MRSVLHLAAGLLVVTSFSQCGKQQLAAEEAVATAIKASTAADDDTEMRFSRYHFTGVPGEEKDFSQTELGIQPNEVWVKQDQSQQASSTYLYRFNYYDVLVQDWGSGPIKLYKSLKAMQQGNSLTLRIPNQPLLQVPEDENAESHYYLTGLMDAYMIVDEGTSTCRRYLVYNTGTLEQIYTFATCGEVKLAGPHALTFTQDTNIPADSLNCYAHLTPEEKNNYHYVVEEQVSLNLEDRQVTRSGQLTCAYRE
ncbi:hypothetical protein CLV24_10528 [Pontibacter ummariensis]|uniref:Uncharacterized protein n=1 Tax=Pontibacter ummariensis TaxID=1610492 RepID=A0A239E1K9_9BACT|nr:hypothetical protein [Pontibacter ummariensis]PRY13658.1 hypothetical protein CLV24_10528 [Pontibacter ummariensis]SNS38138.1 hypothetical protein SAMN06296052_105223 [Pontibacter ummariensis]